MTAHAWPRIPWFRRTLVRVRRWACARVCRGYDPTASAIVDALTVEVEALRHGGRS